MIRPLAPTVSSVPPAILQPTHLSGEPRGTWGTSKIIYANELLTGSPFHVLAKNGWVTWGTNFRAYVLSAALCQHAFTQPDRTAAVHLEAQRAECALLLNPLIC
jgi:hypothetical protein